MKMVLTTLAAMLVASVAAAEGTVNGPTLSGKIESVIKENATGNWGATTSFDLGVAAGDAASASMDFVIGADDKVLLDQWSVGTTVGVASVSVGDQGDIWVAAEGEHTMANPIMDESLMISMDNISVAMEFGDMSDDLTDIEAIQGSVDFDVSDNITATAAMDYDLDAEAYTIGGRLDVDQIGAVMTYAEASDTIAFEVDANMSGITAYLNGDENEIARNIGATYNWGFANLDVEPGVNYDLDAEELEPSITLGFSF